MKVGDKIDCIKDSDHLPLLKKGNKYIIESEYIEIKYDIKGASRRVTTKNILHEDIYYMTTETNQHCLFSLIRRPSYFYFYDYFSIKPERKEKLLKLEKLCSKLGKK